MAKTVNDGEMQVVEPTAVNTPTPFDRWAENMEARARQENRNGSEIMKKQATNILGAETVQDVWDADEGGTVSGKNFLDVGIEIRGYTLSKSGDEYLGGDLDVYANMDCVVLQATKEFQPGDTVVINCGGMLILSKLEKFRSLNAFPVKAILRPAGRAIKLRPFSMPAVPASTE